MRDHGSSPAASAASRGSAVSSICQYFLALRRRPRWDTDAPPAVAGTLVVLEVSDVDTLLDVVVLLGSGLVLARRTDSQTFITHRFR